MKRLLTTLVLLALWLLPLRGGANAAAGTNALRERPPAPCSDEDFNSAPGEPSATAQDDEPEAGKLATPKRCACRREDVKEGSFFAATTDLAYAGGFEPKIERAYNSKSSFRGMFGSKWGGEYEVYLTISADGSILVHEYGGGADYRFSPESFSKEELASAVAVISKAASDAGDVVGQKELAQYAERLRADSDFRNAEWEKYKRIRLVAGRELPLGTVLHSNHYEYQYIKRVRDGYLRVMTGKLEHYDNYGRLTRISNFNRNYIDFSYDAEGRLAVIRDNYGRQMSFTLNSRGLVERIEADRGHAASYGYDERGRLTYSKDAGGHAWQYQYDQHDNLTKVAYADGTSTDITYYGPELGERLKSRKEPNGDLTTYSYAPDPNDRRHLHVEMLISNGGVQADRRLYDYYSDYDERGNEWLHKQVTNLDGEVTETEYNQLNYPVRIRRGGEETTFVYNDKGQVIRKETPTELAEFRYHPRLDKAEWVQHTDKESKRSSWSKFSYDAAGNLLHAENSGNQAIDLIYDDTGRISAIIDQDKSRLEFDYNSSSKPVEIRRVVGTVVQKIVVTYEDDGTTIKKVEAIPPGREIALQVTSTFQKLLEIIKPAGVSLSF